MLGVRAPGVLWPQGLRGFGSSGLRAVGRHGVRALGYKGFIVSGYYGLRAGAQGLRVFRHWDLRVLGRGVFGL